jgi:NNP family nitrate/nitrite transporter-like MFS transporter
MALATLGSASLVIGFAYYRFATSGNFRGASPGTNAFQLFRMPSFWLMLVLFGVGVSTTIGVYAMLPLYLVSERHIQQGWANTMVALSRSHGPIMGFLGGVVSDRLGPKRTIVISLVVTGIATLLLGPVPRGGLTAVVFLQPLLAVWFFPAAFAAIALITPPAARNLAVSFTVPAGYILGGGAVPIFIGIMGDAGSFATGYLATGVLILSGAALAVFLKLPAK